MTKPNGYVLVVSLLIAAFVRHQQDDERVDDTETSILSTDRSADERRKRLTRSSVMELVQFLCEELQHPSKVLRSEGNDDNRGDPLRLSAVFSRLQSAIAKPEDYATVVDEVLEVLGAWTHRTR
ncbi:hypothetical protein Poli38472_007877 [Pythium oligandrum]|uniref:Uncharacterized protein n=1 Tax=Pythium oligandrum TaxID=41045 RepID=A0A8K1FLG1_PYTOL|nr:hypothetical protein Poli38472_007877 [Pythium oligandrum]|eukprot:TMW68205.1 hypothetical protein Poli38472_007877 [Pythium oligandrum]